MQRPFSSCCSVNNKLAGPGFAHGGFQAYLQDYTANSRFYRPFLPGVVLPHAIFFGYFVGIPEFLIGILLFVGLWVGLACVLGSLFLVNMLLATWWAPGHGAALGRYFGAKLDHIPLLLLLIVLYVADGGRMWGLDARRR